MENVKQDRRIERTKKAIKTSLAALLAEKDLNDITVKEIADTADINRKTFYNYYNGVYQVIDEIENDVVTQFESAINGLDIKSGEASSSFFFERFSDMLSDNSGFLPLVFNTKRDSSFFNKIINVLKSKVRRALGEQSELDADTLDIAADFIISGVVEVFRSWFSSEKKLPPERMAKILNDLCHNGFDSLK